MRSCLCTRLACLLLVLAAVLVGPARVLGDVWHIDDADTNGRWGYDFSDTTAINWEPMYLGALSLGSTIPFHPDTTYYAYVHELPKDYRGQHFYAGLWSTKIAVTDTNWVRATLQIYDSSVPSWTFVGADSAASTWWNIPLALSFDFGVLPTGDPAYNTLNKSFVLTFTFEGDTLDTWVQWDGAAFFRSGLYCWPEGVPCDHVVCETSTGTEPAHPDTYWYDVSPNGPRSDFHVRVYDDNPQNYSGWVEPSGWSHKHHKVTVGTECQWWVSWCDTSGSNPIGGFGSVLWPSRFGFTNQNRAMWGRWQTTFGGSWDPYSALRDSSGSHEPPRAVPGAQNGWGARVHVPSSAPVVEPPVGPQPIYPGGLGDAHACVDDWDIDDLQDMAISGMPPVPRGPVTRIFINEGGELVPWQDLDGVSSIGSGNLAWGDCNGDELPDLAVSGMSDAGRITKVFVNDGTGFFDWDGQDLTGVSHSSVAWGDYDADDDLDLLVKGYDGADAVTELYENDGAGGLTLAMTLHGLHSGSADWADYDRDGDLDLLLTGHDGVDRMTILYENDGEGSLVDAGDVGLPAVALSDAEWADYDRDGDLDLALTGEASPTERMARIYENDGTGVLTEVVDLLEIYRSSCAWGDYDLDGDLDIAFCGYTGSYLVTKVFENTESGFVDTGWSFPGIKEGALSWIDVDGDCDCDFSMIGADWNTQYADLYENVRWPTGVPESSDGPHAFEAPVLAHNYPNPFSPGTTIRYALPEAGRATVSIYDLSGRLVRTLVDGRVGPGVHEVTWDGRDDRGLRAASGVYFCRLVAGEASETRKMILLR